MFYCEHISTTHIRTQQARYVGASTDAAARHTSTSNAAQWRADCQVQVKCRQHSSRDGVQ